MKKIYSLLFSSIFFVSPAVMANTHLKMGETLNQSELVKLKGKSVTVAGQAYIVVDPPVSASTSTSTSSNIRTRSAQIDKVGPKQSFVVNSLGAVGISEHDVIITNISANQVQAKAAKIIHSASKVEYYDQIHTTKLKFSNFEKAAKAFKELKILLPEAAMTLPIQYSRPTKR